MGIAIFASQNIFPVTIRLGSLESIRLPLGLVLIFCAGIGAVLMTSLTTISQTSIKFTLPNINKNSKVNSKIPFSNQQPKQQQTKIKNEFTKKKAQYKDDFDDDWNEDWE
ncbi:LapA family protein [Pseudanabaena sp. FACHB-1998]|uniref:lipopolysaccharide assembly protein LapA domain-containing protein n=1 Tax=Pseudanabaena sp. FACHB-1998 TaxID=2692858 RepID=UPI001681521D|nr:LapA family protein [Pseudanabaena sp. FACHB-1998]MBD2175708.1 LapA family protein [Pseudanabaena sp. FACHB-1998]